VRALLASPLGFLIGLSLGALGGGGSILAVPALVYGAGQSPKAATTTSLLLVGGAALVGMRSHRRAGRVRMGTGLAFGAAGIGGSFAGSLLNREIDPQVLLLGFAVLVLVAAWRMVTGCPSCTRVGEQLALADDGSPATPRLSGRRLVEVGLAGTGVGFLSGLFGVGGGFVIIPALTLVLGLAMPEAIGTSLLVIAVNSGVALLMRLGTSAEIEWGVTLPFAVASVMGVVAGGRVADRLDPAKSLRWFSVLLVAVGGYTAVRAGLALAG